MIPNLIVIHSRFCRTMKLNLFASFFNVPNVLPKPEGISPALIFVVRVINVRLRPNLALPYLFEFTFIQLPKVLKLTVELSNIKLFFQDFHGGQSDVNVANILAREPRYGVNFVPQFLIFQIHKKYKNIANEQNNSKGFTIFQLFESEYQLLKINLHAKGQRVQKQISGTLLFKFCMTLKKG